LSRLSGPKEGVGTAYGPDSAGSALFVLVGGGAAVFYLPANAARSNRLTREGLGVLLRCHRHQVPSLTISYMTGGSCCLLKVARRLGKGGNPKNPGFLLICEDLQCQPEQCTELWGGCWRAGYLRFDTAQYCAADAHNSQYYSVYSLWITEVFSPGVPAPFEGYRRRWWSGLQRLACDLGRG